MGPILRYVIKIGFATLLLPLRIFRVKDNQIFLLNDLNAVDANYSSNPKYIAEYILGNHPGEYKIIYALGKKWFEEKESLPSEMTYVKLFSLKYYFYAMTSKVFITTSGGISYIPFKKKQVVINSWHGGGAYKKMGMDTNDDATLRKALKISERKTTYFLSSNKYFTNAVNSSLLIPISKFVPTGLPRNDIFFKEPSDSIIASIKKKYDISQESKIVLYAPTYRTEEESIYAKHTIGPYDIDYEGVVKSLVNRFGGKWVFAIRLHPSISFEDIELPKNVINMSDYYDPQELFVAADVLINDYSSTMWDFSLTRKPCFIYASDLDNYNFKMGFYTEPSQWPFPLTETNEELFHAIETFDLKDYLKELDHYYSWMESYEKGTACKQIIELIKRGETNEIN